MAAIHRPDVLAAGLGYARAIADFTAPDLTDPDDPCDAADAGRADPGPPPSFDVLVGRLRAVGCVFAEDEAALLLDAAPGGRELGRLVDRRVAGVPLEQVLGWAQFAGLRVVVEPGVFVPRRRTELLVEQALVLLRGAARRATEQARPAVVLDLCCGSGAVGAALAAALRSVELHAADVEPAAVRCARRNVEPFGGLVYEGDLYRPLPGGLRGRVDALVVNAPYVPTDAIATMPPEARLHEPQVALDGGADGLDVQRRVAAEAGRWLSPAGHLLMETSERQAELTVAAFTRSGLTARVVRSEELDATVVVGTVDPRPH
jgi:release factor glutamine methyltransferase